MKDVRPYIGITIGDPVGIGPEITLKALNEPGIFKVSRPLVFGDVALLNTLKKPFSISVLLNEIQNPDQGKYQFGYIDVINTSHLKIPSLNWGNPDVHTGKAMVEYILKAIDWALIGRIDAIVTCPINKHVMNMAGYHYHGHTELLAQKTKTDRYAMMMAGDRLKVVLVTIHTALKNVSSTLTTGMILEKIVLTAEFLIHRFGMKAPQIAVAALNPHAGEEGMFGDEEQSIITPAVLQARAKGIDVKGPLPPDTVFYQAVKGQFDAVICMYHDQGLIPFKLIHFKDGVNTTLGLPIIRTSVDHGTAYDIAGKGVADPDSLIAAIKMAAFQASQMLAG